MMTENINKAITKQFFYIPFIPVSRYSATRIRIIIHSTVLYRTIFSKTNVKDRQLLIVIISSFITRFRKIPHIINFTIICLNK